MADKAESFGQQMRNWADSIEAPEAPNDQAVTDNELNNMCFISMKYLIQFPMRAVDFTVVKVMTPDIKTVADLDKRFIPSLANYMHDHLMGGPDDPSVADFEYSIRKIKNMLYKIDFTNRNII